MSESLRLAGTVQQYILYAGPRKPKNCGGDVISTARGCDVAYQGLVFSEGLGLGSQWRGAHRERELSTRGLAITFYNNYKVWHKDNQ